MKRAPALLWLVVLLAAGLYLGIRLHAGLVWQADLLALLPHEDDSRAGMQDEAAVIRALSQRFVLMVGHTDAAQARAAARALIARLDASGLVQVEQTVLGPDALVRLGKLYAPSHRGLLSAADRAALQRGDGQSVANRALSQVFGFVGISDARLLRDDPFLLLAGYFAALPIPFPGLSPVDGLLTVQDGDLGWVLVTGRVLANPYALDVQGRLLRVIEHDSQPGLRILRLGAVFFAQDGAETALHESSLIGLLSTAGTILLILAAYRALSPLWLSLLVIGAGVLAGLAASLLVFGELHVATLLFGVTLIGVSVDYSLQYCTEIFAGGDPAARLRRVRAGITLGTTTTVIGYLTLLFAPFPGLYQIATFSSVGLLAAWLTVVLWLPALDRSRTPRHGTWMLARMTILLDLWRGRRGPWALALAGVVAIAGLWQLRADDDVRRMQSLSPPLLAQQAEIRRLIGRMGDGPFFLVHAPDDEAALRAEETLGARLTPLRQAGALGGWLTPAVFVPSAERQRDNQALVARVLDPLRESQGDRLGIEPAMGQAATRSAPPLTLAAALAAGTPIGSLVMAPGVHVVLLDGMQQPDSVAAAADGLPEVRFVDPAGQFSRLLARYRIRALMLLAASALLMAPPLIWRYGWRGAARVLTPPALAVVLAPALRALAGAGFSFFDAMALVLVLAIGVDYAIFCAETRGSRAPVTMLAVTLAAGTALLSFGLLAFSRVAAVHAFGTTMTIGILLAFAFAPMARGTAP